MSISAPTVTSTPIGGTTSGAASTAAQPGGNLSETDQDALSDLLERALNSL